MSGKINFESNSAAFFDRYGIDKLTEQAVVKGFVKRYENGAKITTVVAEIFREIGRVFHLSKGSYYHQMQTIVADPLKVQKDNQFSLRAAVEWVKTTVITGGQDLADRILSLSKVAADLAIVPPSVTTHTEERCLCSRELKRDEGKGALLTLMAADAAVVDMKSDDSESEASSSRRSSVSEEPKSSVVPTIEVTKAETEISAASSCSSAAKDGAPVADDISAEA